MAVTFGGPKGGVGYWRHGGGLQGDLSPVEVDRVKGHWRALMQTGSVTWQSLELGFLPLLSIPFQFLQE